MPNEPTLTSFTAGDLVISISGDGDGSGAYTDNQASPLTLEELTTSGTGVAQLVLPQTTMTVNGTTEYAFSAEYGSSSEGELSLAADGQSLVIGGYGVNAAAYNTGGAAVYGNAALAQSTSLTDTQFTPVARVVADISYNASIDTTTALYNVFNTNNIRSVATFNGTSFYVSGQGVKGDTTQGVFYAADGAVGATAIDTSTDTREVEIVNGQLLVSRDSKQGAGGETSDIASYGTSAPTSATAPTTLPGIDGTDMLTTGQANTVNNDAVGTTINLSPEAFFFADPNTLYVADGGNPKAGGIGDGGLQKWSLIGNAWTLDYTLSEGLNLTSDTNSAGTTGLIGLTGTVDGGVVDLYATNSTIGDTDQTYLFGITDTLDATILPTDESFTTLVTAAPDTNIRGISFAPTPVTATTSSIVGAGMDPSGMTVTSDSVVTVASGGAITGTTVLSGGTVTISSGGVDNFGTLAHGAIETVLGSATGDQIDGTQTVSSAAGQTAPGSVSAETVYDGGTVDLFIKGATASGLTLTNSGVLNISGNATAVDTVISSGGIIVMELAKAVLSGGVTFAGAGLIKVTAAPTSAGFGDLAVMSGFAAGDTIDLATVGTTPDFTVATSGNNTVATVSASDAAVAQNFTFAGTSIASSLILTSDGAGGSEIVISGGSTGGGTPPLIVSGGVSSTGLTVSAGETVSVQAGGTITGATILNGGIVIDLGVDSGTTISAGGNETVSGTASGDQIYGVQLVSFGTAVVSSETVFNGGSLDLFLKGAVASAVTVSSGGELNINGNAVASNTVLSGGALLDLQSPKATLGGTLTFAGSATLQETDTVSATFGDLAVISNFRPSDVIDVTVLPEASTALTSAVVGGNTVETLTDGGTSQSFTFAGLYAAGYFNLGTDIGGGAEITAAGTPCYCPGTRIATEHGEVAVETLRIGDVVRTHAGALRPIRWIGRRSYAGSFARGQKQILPIRIAAGAIADGVPRRDLVVSPLHAMFIDDALIPADALVNGISIVQLQAVDKVEYIHIELDSHDIILAEGAPSETFVDDDSRAMFHNAHEFTALYPDRLRAPACYCAPRVEDGALLAAVRARLAARARGTVIAGAGQLQGYIDVAGDGWIRGWARDLTNSAPVQLRIMAGEVVLREVAADAWRSDLQAAGIGDGRHAFEVPLPAGFVLDPGDTIRVERIDDGAALPERRAA